MARALRLLAQRDHSRAELERKLSAHRVLGRARSDGLEADSADDLLPASRDEVTRVLDELQRTGWLNDERAAEALVRARSARYGPRRLEQVLRQRSFGAELIARSVASTRASELERAREVWVRRFGQAPGDARERARQMRFLIGRGFDSQTAAEVVRGGSVDDNGAATAEPVD